ncbi:ARM repeat-containing protein [Lanmaoa asiatica]|nr:ARM repeat-containing protein [Lanmaoa asiatica]
MASNPRSRSDETQRIEINMDALRIKSEDPSSLLPDELSHIVAAFVPSQPLSSRSKAYLTLSAFCQGIRVSKSSERSQAGGDEPDEGTLALFHIFQPLIANNLSQSQEDVLLVAVTFHCALFQVDWKSASQIFTGDGFLDLLTTLEMTTSSLVSLALARLYAQASSHKPCRQLFSEESITWLQTKSSQTTDDALRVVAILALVKLAHGSSGDTATIPAGTATTTGILVGEDVPRAAQLGGMIMNSEEIHACLNEAVEGLAYLSTNPSVKKNLTNATVLKRLFSFVPKRKATADATNNSMLIYGVLVIISNLCSYKPRLSQEQQQIAKLRRMAESGKKTGRDDVEEQLDPLESEREVQARCRSAISCGALEVLATASGLDSQGIRSSVGQVLLSFAENKENRGEILRGGGSKMLTRIIQSASSSPDSLPQEALPAIQALAKLAITAPPIQVFGPNEGNVLDAIRPFSQLLLHPSASMLQQFEAMMALTNIASHGPALASRVANTPHVFSKVELLMLEDHTLMRRAATELICNLIAGSEHVFEKYGGANDETTRSTSQDGSSRSNIHVLIAMSDVEDLPTRLAASGALAMLTNMQPACKAIFDLQVERHRAFLVLAQLIDPSIHTGDDDTTGEDSSVALGNPGLVHRGVICIRNLLSNLQSPSRQDALKDEVRKAGLLVVFEKLLKGELGSFSEVVLGPAAEVKKKLVGLSNQPQS